MSDVFADYGARATTTAVPRLVGVIKTRAAAKSRYVEIVAEMASAKSSAELDEYLESIAPELVQFRAEIDFFWNGDGDFAGLQHEIEMAQCRLDDRLDYPRREPSDLQVEGF